MTTINRLYWVSKFAAHEAAVSIKERAGATGRRVHEVTRPRTAEERRHVSLTAEDFEGLLDANLAVLRGAGILQACSAFETALVGYFALCRVYAPRPMPRGYSLLAMKPAELRTRTAAAFDKARSALSGTYSRRLQVMSRRLMLPSLDPSGLAAGRLDVYYSMRHRIVHGQGIVDTDVLDRCVSDVATRAVAPSEAHWQKMLGEFDLLVRCIDASVQRVAVKDQGLQVAVLAELQRKPDTIGHLHYGLRSRWCLQPDWKLVANYVEQAGLRVDYRRRLHTSRIEY